MNAIVATLGVIFVTVLWGSWFQTVKHIKTFPVHAFITLMYGLSVLVVWVSIALFGNFLNTKDIFFEISSNIPLSMFVLLCGICFGIGMQMHLSIVKRIGLILSTSVSASCAILGGTIVTILFSELPKGVTIPLLMLVAVLLISATIVCQYAGILRDKDKGIAVAATKESRKKDVFHLAFINLVLLSSYALANSIALKTPTNPRGFEALTNMGVLVIGAFVGSLAVTLIRCHKEGGLRFDCGVSRKKLLGLALIAACCHFGGNVLHTFFAPVISVTIATALGNSYHLWSYVWGLLYGEFKGSSVKTYAILGIGILLFVIGVVIISLKTV